VRPEEIADGLKQYGIGQKVRVLRLARHLGLVELGRQTGLSAAMLSKIERSALFPTLPTLLRIAHAFGVGLDHFFAGSAHEPVVSIVRRTDRMFPSTAPTPEPAKLSSHRVEAIDFGVPDAPFRVCYAEFDPILPSQADRHVHLEAELIYVLTGQLAIAFDDVEHTLEAGDSMYFEARRPHAYRNAGISRCSALMVTATT
jgi:transcriptional regulator with XRE-family HTH domain